ncbi:hypothetical protein ANN_15568 [Periplaneta americana]|uniref:Uncharacterized protein n=1 Tax=Periplaneta americana TaxID=6978 RepID=A0ABQ8SHF7_PERAM|nr:hypothetical protein ANN_15568 [Periplaneta americana]
MGEEKEKTTEQRENDGGKGEENEDRKVRNNEGREGRENEKKKEEKTREGTEEKTRREKKEKNEGRKEGKTRGRVKEKTRQEKEEQRKEDTINENYAYVVLFARSSYERNKKELTKHCKEVGLSMNHNKIKLMLNKPPRPIELHGTELYFRVHRVTVSNHKVEVVRTCGETTAQMGIDNYHMGPLHRRILTNKIRRDGLKYYRIMAVSTQVFGADMRVLDKSVKIDFFPPLKKYAGAATESTPVEQRSARLAVKPGGPDDQVIISNSEDNLRLSTKISDFGMEISAQKSKVMAFLGQDPIRRCNGRNSEREKSSGQEKISDDRRHMDYMRRQRGRQNIEKTENAG